MKQKAFDKAMEMLTSEDDGRVCKDIPDSACDEQPRNYFIHLLSLTSTKVADGLLDPKLVLSWLITHLGASSFFVGLLVPIREAGALLPQLFTAQHIRALKVRKWVWAFGSIVQGACTIGIGLAALFLSGSELGWAIVILLSILAVARSLCSVSYKDVLGKTISKSKRGSTTGLATSLASAFVMIFALIITFDIFDRFLLILTALFVAGCLWLTAGVIFGRIVEAEGATSGGGNPFTVFKENTSLLKSDSQLQLFILTRALLVSTALAPPFMIALVSDIDKASSINLGLLIVASALASFLSSYVWGRLSDKSSRLVLVLSGLIAGSVLSFMYLYQDLFLQIEILLPVLLFVLMIAYQGVRLGRSTHLVDMANEDTRATYTALSNTIIGLFLLVSSVFSILGSVYGNEYVILVFGLMSFGACLSGFCLKEVQKE